MGLLDGKVGKSEEGNTGIGNSQFAWKCIYPLDISSSKEFDNKTWSFNLYCVCR